MIQGATIHQSVIGVRSVIGEETSLRRTLMMGADFFDKTPKAHSVRLGIGKGCDIQNAIIDKNVRIGAGVKIRDHSRSPDFDGPNYYIRDGIVVIAKDTIIKEGTLI
jgi:glucose-1-phosphate adenylyltransferase